jgi:uncharacterized caspase-like protein
MLKASHRIAVSSALTGVLAAMAVVVLAADAPAPASGALVKERRLALVIGNSAYEAAPLRNPVNDARDFAAALADSGFEVSRLENASLRELRSALRDFGDQLKKQGGVGLFYFAGHGMQVKGRNYLIPVAAQIEREDEVEFESLDANQVLEKLDSAGNRFNIVILDACRNNPFARSFRSSTQGLARMDAPSGAVVAFATSPGSVASDGGGRNGLYSQHLIESVGRPGLKIEEVFKQVRAAVRRDSGGKQTPWESTSLEGDFYFHPVDGVAAETARKQQEQARLAEAVRVAIAQERERSRKEFEEINAKTPKLPTAVNEQANQIASVTPLTPATAASASPAPAEVADVKVDPPPSGVVAGSPPAGAIAAPASPPVISASVAPKLVPPGSAAKPPASTDAVTGAGPVIGTRVQGKIPAPKIVLGDEWELLSITTKNPSNRASESIPIVEKLTAEDSYLGGVSMSRVVLDKAGGQPTSTITKYIVAANPAELFIRTSGVNGEQKLHFPLEPGTNWSYSNDYLRSDNVKGRDEFDCKAVAWEQVTVPAGNFWALRVELRGWRNNLSGALLSFQRAAQRIEGTLWYSPEAKYPVKSIYQTYAGGMSTAGLVSITTTQLVGFSSAESRAASTATATK